MKIEDRFRDVSAEWASKITGALWLKAKSAGGTKEEQFKRYEQLLAEFEKSSAYRRLMMHRNDAFPGTKG